MIVCEVMASYEEGGLENHFIELCNGLAARGHQVHVVVDVRFRSRFEPQVKVHTTQFSRFRYHPLLLWDLVRIINAVNPDVIHSHAGKATGIIVKIKRWLPAPCVATIHNMKKDKTAYGKVDAVIGVSKGVLAGITCINTRTIYNGIGDLNQTGADATQLNKLGLGSTRPVVFAVGRLVPVKGFDVLLNAWQSVDADLVIIGEGAERDNLHNLASALNISPKVHFLGFIENAGALLKYADLLVISSHKEGFNYVMAEALRQSIPVVSTDVPAPNEILPETYLVPRANPKALAERVSEVLESKNSCMNELQPLFDWAATTLTTDNMVEETALYLEEMTAK
ncbi:glycosyltransferase [Neptunomonas sp.]|uniref:glycosyltransferase n=1 Tax=Neptunomonas sp. TaxID=1971898 RepID=UPI0025F21C20|nr:glycosyltransferase [Neptunomonas sp.]